MSERQQEDKQDVQFPDKVPPCGASDCQPLITSAQAGLMFSHLAGLVPRSCWRGTGSQDGAIPRSVWLAACGCCGCRSDGKRRKGEGPKHGVPWAMAP